MKLITMLFITLLHLNATGFDCNKSLTKTERLICENSELSKLDDELNVLYSQALEFGIKSSVQFLWLQERDSCNTIECLIDSYKQRIDFINNAYLQKSNSSIKNVSGMYKSGNYNIELQKLKDNFVSVKGEGYSGQAEHGVHFGQIDGVALIHDNKIYYEELGCEIVIAIYETELYVSYTERHKQCGGSRINFGHGLPYKKVF